MKKLAFCSWIWDLLALNVCDKLQIKTTVGSHSNSIKEFIKHKSQVSILMKYTEQHQYLCNMYINWKQKNNITDTKCMNSEELYKYLM